MAYQKIYSSFFDEDRILNERRKNEHYLAAKFQPMTGVFTLSLSIVIVIHLLIGCTKPYGLNIVTTPTTTSTQPNSITIEVRFEVILILHYNTTTPTTPPPTT